jgi:hypothetical protein
MVPLAQLVVNRKSPVGSCNRKIKDEFLQVLAYLIISKYVIVQYLSQRSALLGYLKIWQFMFSIFLIVALVEDGIPYIY